MSPTLTDFRAMSTGTYNAGMLVLNKNNKLDMVNNHVKMTFLNNKKLNGDEILAVKNAFINAISDSVASNQLQDIKARLGLPAEGSADAFDPSKLSPLTRDEVRQIISQYELGDDRKNANEGKRAIGQNVNERTMKRLYTNVDVGHVKNADSTGLESDKVLEKVEAKPVESNPVESNPVEVSVEEEVKQNTSIIQPPPENVEDNQEQARLSAERKKEMLVKYDNLHPANQRLIQNLLAGENLRAAADHKALFVNIMPPDLYGGDPLLLAMASYLAATGEKCDPLSDSFNVFAKEIMLLRAILVQHRNVDELNEMMDEINTMKCKTVEQYCSTFPIRREDLVYLNGAPEGDPISVEDAVKAFPQYENLIRGVTALYNACGEITSVEELMDCVDRAIQERN